MTFSLSSPSWLYMSFLTGKVGNYDGNRGVAALLRHCLNSYNGVVPKKRKQRVFLGTVLLASPFSDCKAPEVQRTMIGEFKLHIYGKRQI